MSLAPAALRTIVPALSGLPEVDRFRCLRETSHPFFTHGPDRRTTEQTRRGVTDAHLTPHRGSFRVRHVSHGLRHGLAALAPAGLCEAIPTIVDLIRGLTSEVDVLSYKYHIYGF